jgi:flagellar biosynthesis protein FlhG
MKDQAQILREMMERRRLGNESPNDETAAAELVVIGVTSGNGGAGKTTVALNLALALQEKHRVCLWDVSGTAALEILCNCSLLWNLSHVFEGSKRLPEVLADGPQGLKLLAGPGLSMLRNNSGSATARISTILESLGEHCDVLILDLPVAIDRDVQCLLDACDASLLIATPDPTSVTAAYSTLKSSRQSNWSLLVNQAGSSEEAVRVIERFQETSRLFLQQPIEAAGFVPADGEIKQSSRVRKPLMLSGSNSTGAQAIARLAERVEATTLSSHVRTVSKVKSA